MRGKKCALDVELDLMGWNRCPYSVPSQTKYQGGKRQVEAERRQMKVERGRQRQMNVVEADGGRTQARGFSEVSKRMLVYSQGILSRS